MNDLIRLIEAVQLAEYGRANLTPPSHTPTEVDDYISQLIIAAQAFERSPEDGERAAAQMQKYRLAYELTPPVSRYEIIQYHLYVAVQLMTARTIFHDALQAEIDFDKFALGLVPTVGPNAHIVQAKASDKIAILFNVGLIPLLSALAGFIAHAGDLKTERSGALRHTINRRVMARRTKRDPSSMLRLFDVMDAILFGSLGNLPLEFTRPPLPAGRIYQIYLSAMLQFVIGHELGHVALRHLAPGAAPTPSSQRPDGATLELRQQQELEADGLGLIYAQLAHEELARQGGVADPGLRAFGSLLEAHYGADMLLRIFALLEQTAARRLGLGAATATAPQPHPPFSERLDQVYALTIDRCPDAKPYIDNSIEIAVEVMTFLEAAYDAHLAKLKKPPAPSAMWRRAFGLA